MHGPWLGALRRDLQKVRKHVEVRKRKKQVKRNTFSSESVCQISKHIRKASIKEHSQQNQQQGNENERYI